jgi:hypothetical protein
MDISVKLNMVMQYIKGSLLQNYMHGRHHTYDDASKRRLIRRMTSLSDGGMHCSATPDVTHRTDSVRRVVVLCDVDGLRSHAGFWGTLYTDHHRS